MPRPPLGAAQSRAQTLPCGHGVAGGTTTSTGPLYPRGRPAGVPWGSPRSTHKLTGPVSVCRLSQKEERRLGEAECVLCAHRKRPDAPRLDLKVPDFRNTRMEASIGNTCVAPQAAGAVVTKTLQMGAGLINIGHCSQLLRLRGQGSSRLGVWEGCFLVSHGGRDRGAL